MEAPFAYLDPGTGSLVLQALVAGFAGLVVAGKYGWRWLFGRVRKPALSAPLAHQEAALTGSLPATEAPLQSGSGAFSLGLEHGKHTVA